MTNCDKREYTPYAASGSAMELTEPVTTPRGYTTLQYPLDTPTLDIDIRNPDVGNQHVINLAKVLNRSRSGTINLTNSEHKPKIKTFTYTIQNLCDDEKIAIKNFINNTLGQMIRVIDYESRTWNVILTNPSAAISELSREMAFTIKLQFKGTLE